VSLLDFNGMLRSKAVELTWRTTMEVNSLRFEVYRSADGANFRSIGSVDAAGNAVGEKAYRFTDHVPAAGANYYKLKQVDKDGSYTWSRSIYIHNAEVAKDLKFVASTDHSLTLSAYRSKAGPAMVMLAGLDGKMLHQRKVVLHEGVNFIQIPASIARGTMGIVALRTETDINSIKIIR
ncbi:MAG TPA: hypothetical protein VK907_01800, partial [Phnomibacter sp.]|nr:hypothetical protein [Phnomibacter sp.]